LFSGRITAPWRRRKPETTNSLNPFVFRAYYCVTRENPLGGERVSIPLFSGRITARASALILSTSAVSIPLFSGRITASVAMQKEGRSCGLNPFVFRAYYCAIASVDAELFEASQSLCFQGVLLRPSPP